MPIRVTAQARDTLCSLAIQAGFVNCTPLREHLDNRELLNRPLRLGDRVTIPDRERGDDIGGTEARHRFGRRGVPLPSVRFVHGSQHLPYHGDSTLGELNVSNCRTTHAGANRNRPWVDHNHRSFDADADADPDTFKVEIHDPNAGGGHLTVELDVMRPLYDAGGRHTGRYGFFPGGRTTANTERNRRSLDAQCDRQGGSNRYRTCYLRLVTDDADKAARPQQTLIVTDMHDQGDTHVEILDQRVVARYYISHCNAPAAQQHCFVWEEISTGTDRRRLQVAVHVLRNAVGGAPVVTTAQAERRIKTWFRRVYAQASIAPQLAQAVREVDPAENLVSISNDSGLSAAGDGALGFRINASAGATQTIGPDNPPANQSPINTANALAALVRAPFVANVTQNPPRFNDFVGSADIVITHSDGNHVTIDNLVSNDSRQTLMIGRVNPTNLQSWDGTNWLVGSIQQRTALKNYDTGHDRIDIVVCQAFTSGTRGQAMMSGHQIDPGRRAIDPIKWSAFVNASTADVTDTNPFTMPHECGHVALELVHATGALSQFELMMGTGTTHLNAVDASKRITDGNVTFDWPAGSYNQVTRIRAEAALLLTAW